MRLPPSVSRRDTVSLALLSWATTAPLVLRPEAAQANGVGPRYNPGQSADELQGALGGLKPGTGRALNGLIKMRAVTGVERLSLGSYVFKPGQVLDEVRAVDGSAVSVSFNFPESWIAADGPNIDVRDVKESDSAFLLVAPLPTSARGSIEKLPPEFFIDVLFSPQGKYGAYGAVDERKVTSSSLVELSLPSGGQQPYRRLALSFSPLTYNQNLVERRALVSATAVGGSAFIFVTGCLANRYKKVKEDLLDTNQSFRAIGSGRKAPPREEASSTA